MLKEFPEQIRPDLFDATVSGELRYVLVHIPVYRGIIPPEGDLVEVSYLKSLGYNPELSLKIFFQGAKELYETMPYSNNPIKRSETKNVILYVCEKGQGSCSFLYIPNARQTEIDEKIDEFFGVDNPIKKRHYSCSFEELKEEINDDERNQ